MEQTLFWGCWLATLCTTALLLYWSLPLSPFTHPGIAANEAVIIFFPIMTVRWFALATMMVLIVNVWGQRLSFTARWILIVSIGVLALHFILGVVNLAVMNAWLSVNKTKTRATDVVYAAIYFGLPALLLLLTVSFMLNATLVRR